MNALIFALGVLTGMTVYKVVRETAIRKMETSAAEEAARERRGRRHERP